MAITDNLISHWKLDEASGNRADSHGSNTLTDNNTVTSGTGKINNAASFATANSEYLSHTDNASLSTGDIDFTFAAWVKFTTRVAEMIFIGKDQASGRDYTLDYDVVDNKFRFYVNGGANGVANSTKTDLANDVWYFVVAWHDSVANTQNIQVNNGIVDSISMGLAVPIDTATPFHIGARSYSGAERYFNGHIDEVSFWKRTLTTDEKTAIYNDGDGLAYPWASGNRRPINGGLLNGGLVNRGLVAA